MDTEILTTNQQALLVSVAGDTAVREKFYLTGGTALAGFYLSHRFSEDLDFFSETELDVELPTAFLQKQRLPLGVTEIDFQQSYNRNLFFLTFPDEIVKVEFTYFPFPRIDLSHKHGALSLDSPLDIAVNKLFTIHQKPRARDYIDLYCLIQKYHWSVCDLVDKARLKFDWHIDPLQLGTNFLAVNEVADVPRMVLPLPEAEWKDFFVKEAEKLGADIML